MVPSHTIGFRCQYKEDVFTKLIRKKQFTVVDFWAFIGGILGLFTGFSALSFVELIYWFTIRVSVVNWKKSNTKVHPINKTQVKDSNLSKIKKFSQSYLSESSIHGLGYVSEFSWINR